jgi:heme/copper-type cytochrome/quinol oxidase subunit 2
MKKLSQVQKSIALPLIGEIWGWLFFVAAVFVNQIDNQLSYRVATYTPGSSDEHVHLGTYLFLVAIAGFSFTALSGQRLSIAARADLGDANLLARAAQRFTTLAVVVALAFGAILAIGNFMGAFGYSASNAQNALVRILDVYLPILLATGLVVFVILQAFVFREGEHQEGEKDKRGLTETQKALGLGYALPIITTAFAIILGLIVYDVTKTTLQVWVWVLIQVIVVGGVVQGTRFASKAKQGSVRPPRERRVLAAGAAGLNFVLSIVFGGVVSIMAFSYGAEAVGKLQNYPEYDANGNVIGSDKVTVDPITFTWILNDLLPSLVLLALAVVGIYWTLIARNSEANKENRGEMAA